MKKKPRKKAVQQSTVSAEEIQGGLDCLLHGLRATGTGLCVLTVDDVDFREFVCTDDDYREMIVEILKLLFVQAGYDATCAALVEKARQKIIAALVAHGDASILEAFKRPVDFDKIPPMGAINIDYVNSLRSEWVRDAASH